MWTKPGVRALWPLLLVFGCQANAGGTRQSSGATAGTRSAGSLDPGLVRPLTLRYRAVHRGDHRPWSYIAHVRIQRDSFRGAPAWRTSYRIEDLGTSGPRARWESTTIVDRDTLALLAGEDVSGGSFGDSRTRVTVEGVHLVGETEARGVRKAIDVELRGLVARDIDLLALSLPLRAGYRLRFAVVNESSDGLRPFAMSVEGQERVRVPAGQFDAWRIAVTPLDGDRRATATYHVRDASPRVVLRKEYVVNPETRGPIRRSVGLEELE
jgi:hypothetical protein